MFNTSKRIDYWHTDFGCLLCWIHVQVELFPVACVVRVFASGFGIINPLPARIDCSNIRAFGQNLSIEAGVASSFMKFDHMINVRNCKRNISLSDEKTIIAIAFDYLIGACDRDRDVVARITYVPVFCIYFVLLRIVELETGANVVGHPFLCKEVLIRRIRPVRYKAGVIYSLNDSCHGLSISLASTSALRSTLAFPLD